MTSQVLPVQVVLLDLAGRGREHAGPDQGVVDFGDVLELFKHFLRGKNRAWSVSRFAEGK